MVQKLVFDPQKLIDEEKENEKKKVEEVLTDKEEYEKALEKENAKAKKIEETEERKGIVSEVFEGVRDALKEVNYAKKYGGKEYLKAKEEEDPDDPIFDSPIEKLREIKKQFTELGSVFKDEFKG